MAATSDIKDRGITEGEARAAMAMRERAAHTIDKMGDARFAQAKRTGNGGMAAMVQSHYLNCAAAVRDLPLTSNAPEDGAGTIICRTLSDLVDGLQDMRKRDVVPATDDLWMEDMIKRSIAALKLNGHNL